MGEVRNIRGGRKSKVVAAGTEDPRAKVPAIKRPKREIGGNSPCDIAWMEAEADNLRLLNQEELPKDLVWDIKYIWDGEAEEINPDFWNEWRKSRQCNGQAYIRDERGGYIFDREWQRLRRPCLMWPMLGTAVCSRHGGEIIHVKKAAQTRLGMASDLAAYTLVEMTNPRDSLGELVDHRVRVAAANSVLDRTGIKAGAEVEVKIPGYQRVLDQLFGAGTDGED